MTIDGGRGDLALDFVGTLHERGRARVEHLRTPLELAGWLRGAGVVDTSPPVTDRDLREALALRAAVYRAARALVDRTAPDPADLAVLNAAAAPSPPMPQVAASGRVTRSGDVAAALAAVARDAVTLWELDGDTTLKGCADDHCTRMFLDRSRGGRRRWCGMAGCGDRAKARAYRARRRASAG